MKNKTILGYLAGLVAALGWATIGLWVSNINLDYYSIALIRFLLCGFLFLLGIGFLFIFKRKVQFKKKSIFKALGLGILLFLQVLFAIFTYKNLSIGEANVVANLHLIFIIIFVFPLILKNKKLPHFLTGTLLLFLGISIIFKQSYQFEITGIITGITCSFLFAIYSYLSEKILPNEADKYLGFMFSSGGIVGLVFSNGIPITSVDTNTVLNILILCIFSTFIAMYCFLYAVKTIGSLGASIISYSTILFGVLIEGIISKQFLINQIAGALVVFVSMIFLLLTYRKIIDNKIS